MTDTTPPRAEDQRRAQDLRRIALKCLRGMADARDAGVLTRIADELYPAPTIVPDSPSGDCVEHVQV